MLNLSQNFCSASVKWSDFVHSWHRHYNEFAIAHEFANVIAQQACQCGGIAAHLVKEHIYNICRYIQTSYLVFYQYLVCLCGNCANHKPNSAWIRARASYRHATVHVCMPLVFIAERQLMITFMVIARLLHFTDANESINAIDSQ